YVCLFVFFFSSRRRHTRCYRDWSSDVCSSDLRRKSPRREPAPGAPDEAERDGRDRERQEQAHAVGTSVLSRMDLSAASAVTPSSSSSGATVTRCRSTAGASRLTSSGLTNSRSSSSADARAALSHDTPARG